MRRPIIVSVFTIISLALTVSAQSSPVWKISKDDHHLYVGGTIHLLSPSDHPLPKAFEIAFNAATTLVFETDMEAMKSPVFMQKAALSMMYTDGRTLDKTLSEKSYQALSQYLTENKIPPATFAMFTPTGVMLTLTVMEYQKLGMVQDAGVDTVMHKKAKQAGKAVDFLETPDEQLRFLTNMAVGDEDEMVLYTLAEIHKLPSIVSTMKSAWRKGDLAVLNKTYMNDLEKDFPNAYNMLIKDRNNKWLPKIESMLLNTSKQNTVEFVLVGALHLAGKDGVLTQLKNKGYKVEKLK